MYQAILKNELVTLSDKPKNGFKKENINSLFQNQFSNFKKQRGPRWDRTTDLTLIKRTL